MVKEKDLLTEERRVSFSELKKGDIGCIAYCIYAYLVARFIRDTLFRTFFLWAVILLISYLFRGAVTVFDLFYYFIPTYVFMRLIEKYVLIRTKAFSFMPLINDLNIRTSLLEEAYKNNWDRTEISNTAKNDIEPLMEKLKEINARKVSFTTHILYTEEALAMFANKADYSNALKPSKKVKDFKIEQCYGGVKRILITYLGERRNTELPVFNIPGKFPKSMFPLTKKKLTAIRKYSGKRSHYKITIYLE